MQQQFNSTKKKYQSHLLASSSIGGEDEGYVIVNMQQQSSSITLLSLKFSPIAVRVDTYACGLEPNTFLRCVLHSCARLLSLVTKHETVEFRVTEDPHPHFTANIVDVATDAHRRLLTGKSTTLHCDVQTPAIVLILWSFNKRSGFHDAFTSLKRMIPQCHLSMDEAIAMPMCYYVYRQRTAAYMPSPELLTVIPQQQLGKL